MSRVNVVYARSLRGLCVSICLKIGPAWWCALALQAVRTLCPVRIMHICLLCAAEVETIAELRADMMTAGSNEDFLEAQRCTCVLHYLAREHRHI